MVGYTSAIAGNALDTESMQGERLRAGTHLAHARGGGVVAPTRHVRADEGARQCAHGRAHGLGFQAADGGGERLVDRREELRGCGGEGGARFVRDGVAGG